MRRLARISRIIGLALVLGVCSVVAAQDDRTLVIAQGIDIHGFDVQNHSTVGVEAVHVNLFDYLVFRNEAGEIEPALATEYEPISDTAWRFVLRQGVFFHNGDPFTAQDVKFTLDRVISDASLAQHAASAIISEIEIVNDHEVIIHTATPDPILLNRLSRTGSGILPASYIAEVGWEGFDAHPVGTGPYKFVEWRRDEFLRMEAFENHWRGVPHYTTLIHRTIPEASTRIAELLTGGVQVATNVPPQDVERIEAASGAEVYPWPTVRVMQLYVNTAEDRPTHDLRVRQAIDYAIDNQLLIDALMGGLGTPVRAAAVPGISGAPLKYYDTFNYDPERSVELLAAAGYGPGELTVQLDGPAGRYPQDTQTLELVSVMLEAVGINVEFSSLEWSAFQSRVWGVAGIRDAALIGLGNSMVDGWFALESTGRSFAQNHNWQSDRLLEILDLSAEELDESRREELLEEGFDLVVEGLPQIFLFQLQNLAGISSEVDWQPRTDELLWMFNAKPAQ